MHEIDLNQLLNALISGGAVWAAIRAEIKFLWRDVDTLKQQIEKLKEAAI